MEEEDLIFEEAELSNLESLSQANNNKEVEKDSSQPDDFVFSDQEINLSKIPNPFNDDLKLGGELDLFTNPDKYPFQLRVDEDNNKLRALQQSNWDQFGNAISQGILDGIIGQTIGAVGSIAGITEAGIDKYIKNEPADFNNLLITWSNNIKEFSQDQFPIYKENPTKAFDIGDFAWWAQGVTSIASTVGLLIPGMAAGKVFGRGANLISGVLKAAPETAALAAELTQLTSSALVMRNAESFAESSVLVNELKSSLTNKWKSETEWQKALNTKTAKDLRNQGIKVTKETLSNHIASKAGWRAYHLNSANLLFDIIQIAPLLRLNKLNKLGRGLRPKTNIPKASLSKTKRIFNSFGGTLLRQSTEGIEEAINFVSTEEGRYFGNTLAGETEIALDKRTSGYLTDGHFWESAFWGVIGGITFEGAGKAFTKLSQTKRNKNKPKEELSVKNFNTELVSRKAIVDETSAQIKSLESGEVFIDANGEQHDLSSLSEKQRQSRINDIKYISGINLGINAAKSDNVEGLIEQLKDTNYLKSLQDGGLVQKENIQQAQTELENNIKKGEELYTSAIEISNKVNTKDDKEKNTIIGKSLGLLQQKEFLNKKVSDLTQEESVLKNSSDYINASTENTSLDSFLNIEAIKLAKLTLNEDLAIQDGLLDENISKQKINTNLEKLEESLEDLVKDDTKPDINLSSLDFQNVINTKADKILAKELSKEYSNDIANITTPQSLNKIKEDIRKKDIENKKIEREEFKSTLDKFYNVNENDKASDIQNKISKLEEEILPLSQEEKNTFKSLYDQKLSELRFALNRVNSDKNITPIEGEEDIDIRDLETIQKEFIDVESKNIQEASSFSLEENYENIINTEQSEIEQEQQIEELEESSNLNTSIEDDLLKSNNQEIQKNINPTTIIKEGEEGSLNIEQQESRENEIINPESSTNIVLAVSPTSIVSSTEFIDTENITISPDNSLFELFKGQYKEGDTIKLQPQLDNFNFANPKNPETIAIAIIGKNNKTIGFLNSVPTKRKFISQEISRLKQLKETPEIQTKIVKLNNELKSLIDLRNHIFQNKSSFSLAPFSSKISQLTSGSIINISEQQKIKDSFGDNIILYKVSALNNNILEPMNLTKVESHRRQAYDDSTLNNIDSIYTPGIFYTLVNTPNNKKFPVPLQSEKISDLYINKIYEGFQFIADKFLNKNLDVSSSEIKTAKDILNEITYIGKNNIEIFSNNIKIINRNSEKKEAVKIFFNNSEEGITFNVQQGNIVNDKFKKTKTITNNNALAEQIIKNILSNLLFNPNKKFANTTENYVSPISKNFDGTIKENPITFNNYLSYLNDSNILSTNIGTVKDTDNNILSNFSIHGKSNLVFGISTEFKKQDNIKVTKSESIKLDNTSVTNIIFSKFDSFKVLKDKLKLSNKFNLLYDYADEKGIKITNRSKINSIAATNKKSGNISFNRDILSDKESEGNINNLLEEVLAHEIIHGFLIKEVKDSKRLDQELLGFITDIKNRKEDIPNSIKSLISYALETSPQEIVTLAYTNKEFSDWLNSIKVKNIDNTSISLLTKLKDIIKNLISSTLGFTALDQLDNIVSNNINKNINIDSIEDISSIYENDLGEFFNFPSLNKPINISDTLKGSQEKEAVDVLSAMFIKVAEKSTKLSADQNKEEFRKLLKTRLINDNYNAKENLTKVLNNFDSIWDKVVRNIQQKFNLSFSENIEEDSEFVLEKDFDSTGSSLERNVKDTVPNQVKDIIRRTPIIESITDNNIKYKKSKFLQFPEFLNFDIVYPYLQDKLSNILDERDLIDRLNTLSNIIPSFILIKEDLIKDRLSLSAWVSHFDKQKVDFIKETVNTSSNIIENKTIISSNNNPIYILTNSISTKIENNIITDFYKDKNLDSKIKNLNNLFKNYQKNKSNILTNLEGILIDLNFNYSDVNLKEVIEKELINPVNIEKYGTESNILDNIFIKRISFISKSIENKSFDNYNDVFQISKAIEKYVIVPLQNSFLNVNGKPNYAITLPNFLSKYFKDINNDSIRSKTNLKNLISNYLKIPSLSKSNWVNKMFIQNNNDIVINNTFFDNFNYYISDGLKNNNTQTGVSYNKFNQLEWDLNNLLKFNKSKNIDFFETPILIPADSSSIYYLNVPKFKTLFNGTDIKTSSPSYEAVLNTVYQEIEAMKQAKDLMFEVDTLTGRILGLKENLDVTKLQLSYHYKIDSSGNKIFTENNKPVGNVFKFQNIDALNNSSLLQNGLIAEPYNKQDQVEELKSIVNDFIQLNILEPAKNEFINIKPSLYPLVFNEPYTSKNQEQKNIKDNKWNEFIQDYVLNVYIANNEMLNLFYGNLAEYKNKIDIGKRLKQVIAPGLSQSNISNNGTFNVITLKDIELQSDAISSISNTIKENLKSNRLYTKQESLFSLDNILNKNPNSKLEKDTFDIIKPYFKVNSTDAQGYITLDRFSNILFNEGRLTKELEESISKAKKGEILNINEISQFFEPVKGFYYDRFYDSDLNKLVSKQIKYSTFPLIPTLTKNTQLDKIRKYLENNNIDEAIFESAVKVGAKNIIKTNDSLGNLIDSELSKTVVETLNNSRWQRQLDVPDDIQDKEKLLAVQIARIIFGNTKNNKDFNLFSDILDSNISESSSKVLNDLGFSIDQQGDIQITDKTKVQESLINEVEERNLPVFFKEALEFKEGTTDFKLPLFISSLSKKFQSIFLSRFTKGIIDQKLAGFSAVQFSSAFFTKEVNNENASILSDNIDSSKDISESLQFIKEENGWTAEVFVSPYDSKFFKNGKTIDINTIPEKSKTFIGYRIPTDSKHSIINFKVVGFLPRESSSSIIVPKEITTQMGSDFDVDKLFIMRYNLNNNLDIVKYDTEKSPLENSLEARQNKIVDIFQKIITSKDNIEEVTKPSEFSNIKEIANISNNLYKLENNNIDITTYTGQKELRKRNLSGQELTGIAANFNTFNYLAQKTNMIIEDNQSINIIYNKSDIDVKFIKDNFNTGVETSDTIEVIHNTLSKNNNNFQNVNQQFISDILGENLASAVDTVKAPIHPNFNSNIFTFPVFSTMVMTGIDHKVAGLFINQPIIKDLTNKFLLSKSNIIQTNNSYINTIRTNYENSLLKILGKSRKTYDALLAKDLNEASDYIGYNIGTPVELKLSELKSNIRNFVNPNEPDLAQYYINQLEILETFLNIKSISDEVNNLISVTKVDNLGTGPTISLNQELVNSIENINKVTIIEGETIDSNIIKVNNSNAIKSIYPRFFGLDQSSVYPILESYLDLGNLTALESSGQLFIQGTDYFNEEIKSFLSINNIFINKKNIDKINNLFISRLISKSESLQDVDYNSLLGLNEGIISVAEELHSIKNNPIYDNITKDIGNILNYLEPDLSQPIKRIKYNNINDTVVQELLYDSFRSLYTSNDSVLSKLAEDLFKYSFISSGLNFSGSSFSSLIPVELYQDFNVVKELEDSHRKALSYEKILDDSDFDIIIRNNWKDNSLVPKVNKRQIKELQEGFIQISRTNNFISNKIKNSDYVYYPKYRKATREELQKNKNNKFIIETDFIYQKIGETENNFFYVPVPKLGEKGIIDFYDNINTESKNLYKDFSYNDIDEAYTLLEELIPEISFVLDSNNIDESRIEIEDIDIQDNTEQKINILTNAFKNVGVDVNLSFNENLTSNAQIENINGIPSITLNPNKVFEDTVIHEFGHIYVDLLGYNSPQIQFGINQLKDTELWKEVREAYPELNKEKFEKEVLVTAIGREGANIFNNKNKENRFLQFLRNLWERFSNLLNLGSPNIAKDLASEMINSKLQRDFNNKLSFDIQKSKDLKLTKLQKFINKRIVDTEKQINRFKDEEFETSARQFITTLEGLDKAEQVTTIAEHINKRVFGINKRLDSIEADKKPSSDNFNKLFNSFVVLNSFEDLFNLDTSNLPDKSESDKLVLEAIKELDKAIAPLIKIRARAKEISEQLLRQKLEPLSSNPDIINGIIDIFDIQKDESNTQRWLDALADTNNSFISLVVKDFNIVLDNRNINVQNEIKDFNNQLEILNKNDIQITDFLAKDSNGKLLDSLITEFDYSTYQDNKDDMWTESKKLQQEIEKLSPIVGDRDVFLSLLNTRRRLKIELNLIKDTIKKQEVKNNLDIIQNKIESLNILDKETLKKVSKLVKSKNKLQIEWHQNNEEKSKDFDKIIENKKEELSNTGFKEWRINNSIIIGDIVFPAGELAQPKSSVYKNKQFENLMKQSLNEKDKVKQDFYIYLRDLMSRMVEGNNTTFLSQGKIPAVPIDMRSYWKAIREDALKLRNKENIDKEDDRQKLVNVDESGNIINVLIQPYLKSTFDLELQKIPEEASLEEKKKIIDKNNELKKKHRRLISSKTNLNLQETIPEFIKSSYNFNARKSFESEMLLSSEIFKFQELEKSTNLYDKIATSISGKPSSIITSSREAAVKKHLDDYITMVFYDNFEASENETFVKAVSSLQNFTSLTQIGFNPFVGINNKIFGTVQNIIESSGGFFFNKKDYRKARKFYNKGDAILSFLGGRNNAHSTTVQEAITKTFDIFQSQTELSGRKGGPIRTVLDKFKIVNDAAYAMQNIGEHTLQNVSLFAMLNSHKLINNKVVSRNDFIESNLNKITKNLSEKEAVKLIKKNKIIREKAIEEFDSLDSLLDNYELVDGYAQLKEGNNLSPEEFSKFRQKVISVNQYLHGIYNKEDAGTLQKYAIGRLALQMKKWMRPGWNRRFGTKFGQGFWNERRESPDEGMYATTYNFIKDLVKDHKNLSTNYKIQWHSLSEFQRSNVRKTGMEMAFLLGGIMLLNVAQSLADDDDELKDNKVFNMFVYQTDRLWKEIFTYFPLFGWAGEGRKLIKSPAASLSIIDNSIKLSSNILMYPFRTEKEREYQSGVRYGQDKIVSGLVKLIPLVNKAERLQNIRKNNEFYSLL